MSINPYLNFNGNTKDAIFFYKKAFNTEEPEIMYFRDIPPEEKFPVTEENKDIVMHASLEIKGTTFMFSDADPGNKITFGSSVTLMFGSEKAEELQFAYDTLREGGKIVMELQETFWSKSYGYLVDKFGVGWQFNLND